MLKRDIYECYLQSQQSTQRHKRDTNQCGHLAPCYIYHMNWVNSRNVTAMMTAPYTLALVLLLLVLALAIVVYIDTTECNQH